MMSGFLVDKSSHAVPIVRVLAVPSSDDRTSEAFSRAVTEALGDGVRLVIDFSEIDCLPSVSIGFLAQTYARMQSNGGDLVLVVSPENKSIRRLLKVTRLSNVLTIADTIEKALKHFEGNSRPRSDRHRK